MIPAIYGLSLLISIAVLVAALSKRKINDGYYLMLSFTIVICNFGYFLGSLSTTLEAAIMANRFSYLGCFLPFCMFMVISRICRLKIHKWVSIPMALYAVMIYLCVLSIGKSPIYYKTVELAFEHGGAVLIRTYGIAHSLYNLMLYGYLAATVIAVFVSFKKKQEVSYITGVSLCVVMVTTCFAFFITKYLPMRLELMPIVYAINGCVLVYWLWKSDMYDVSVGLIRSREESNHTGYLIFDHKKRYCGADEVVKDIYPEVSEFCIDKLVPKSNTLFYNDIVTWFYENADKRIETSTVVNVDQEYYKVVLLMIKEGRMKRHKGYLLEFSDVTSEQTYIHMIDNYNEHLERDVLEKTESIIDIQNKTIIGIAAIIENRDNSTGDHIRRTSDLIGVFAEALLEKGKFSEEFLRNVIKAAPMHDLGKISIDDRILRKQGIYNAEECDEMHKHAAAGAVIVEQILGGIESPKFVEIASNMAHYHHEKWNGGGYPDRLSGEDIPPEARIMALADVFDALVSKRCYKEAYSCEIALEIIESLKGAQFDPELCDIFLSCRDRLSKYCATGYKDSMYVGANAKTNDKDNKKKRLVSA